VLLFKQYSILHLPSLVYLSLPALILALVELKGSQSKTQQSNQEPIA